MTTSFKMVEAKTHGKVTPLWGIYKRHIDFPSDDWFLTFEDERPLLFEEWRDATNALPGPDVKPEFEYVILCAHVQITTADEHHAAGY